MGRNMDENFNRRKRYSGTQITPALTSSERVTGRTADRILFGNCKNLRAYLHDRDSIRESVVFFTPLKLVGFPSSYIFNTNENRLIFYSL